MCVKVEIKVNGRQSISNWRHYVHNKLSIYTSEHGSNCLCLNKPLNIICTEPKQAI